MVLIDGSEGASVQLATCCRPIPGDAIVGYLGRGEGLMVHTADAASASACSSATASAGCASNGPSSRRPCPALVCALEQALADAALGGMHREPFAAAEVADDRVEGLTVHTAECSVGKRLLERDSERWMGVGCSAHSTPIQRSLSRSSRRLPTLHSAACTVSPSPRPRLPTIRVTRDQSAAGGEPGPRRRADGAHRRCSVGKRLLERDSERWMRVDWAEQPTRSFETAVSLLVKNGKGVLAQVASAVSHAEADITHIDMGHEPASETTELKLLLSVRDRLHLAEVMRTLKRSPAVLRVARVKP